MRKMAAFLIAGLVMATVGFANAQQRELGAHEHGVGQLNIAFEGASVVMELKAPGADIVGFEHLAISPKDRVAIDRAIAALAKPMELFAFPKSALCVVVKANLAKTGAEEHHAGHEEHNHEEVHTEFHAEYKLNCAQPISITQIDFPYFETFTNAKELEVQLITEKDVNRFNVERDNPRIDLAGMF